MALSLFGPALRHLASVAPSAAAARPLAVLSAAGALQQAARTGGAAAAAATGWQRQLSAPFAAAAAAGSEPPAFRVSDLVDAHSGPFGSPQHAASPLQVLQPGLRNYGGRKAFYGQVSTVKLFNGSNVLVHEAVQQRGAGKVLVIDNHGSKESAVLGDILAGIASRHGWEGLVVNGCIRDAFSLPDIDIGVQALAANPTKPGKAQPAGLRDVPVVVAGVVVKPGDWLYADEDGILVSPAELELPDAEVLAEMQKSYGGAGQC